jgi:hypothetical protein
MVWKQTPEGTWYSEPPYTKAEERDLDRRLRCPPVAILYAAPRGLQPQSPPPQEPEEEPRS